MTKSKKPTLGERQVEEMGKLLDLMVNQAIKYGEENGSVSIPIANLVEYRKIIKKQYAKGVDEQKKKFDPYKKPKSKKPKGSSTPLSTPDPRPDPKPRPNSKKPEK